MPIEIVTSLISSVIGGLLVAIVNQLFVKKKNEAETEKLNAEAEKIKAEAEKVRAEIQRVYLDKCAQHSMHLTCQSWKW